MLFSHGSGAFRASYIYWTEYLASHGFCVVACDLYTTGYDDLARNGYEVEYPTVQLRLERLFYEIDKSGVLFDLRGSSVVPRMDQTAASRTAGRENIKENVKNSFSNFTQPPAVPQGSSPAQAPGTRRAL